MSSLASLRGSLTFIFAALNSVSAFQGEKSFEVRPLRGQEKKKLAGAAGEGAKK